jgi:hypothetical protein
MVLKAAHTSIKILPKSSYRDMVAARVEDHLLSSLLDHSSDCPWSFLIATSISVIQMLQVQWESNNRAINHWVPYTLAIFAWFMKYFPASKSCSSLVDTKLT